MAARFAKIAPWELAAAPKGWRTMIEDAARAYAKLQRRAGG